MPFSAYNPTYAGTSYAPSVVPSAYHQPLAGSIAPFSPYGASMYSPDDDYFGHGGSLYGHGGYGHGDSLYGHGGSLYGHGGSLYGHGGSLYGHGGYGHGGSHYGHQGYPGRPPYMDSYNDYGYDYDDDYYGNHHDPHYYSSRYRHHYPHHGYGRGYHHRAMTAYYAPKAYQITGDGGVKTLRYGHEHFKDKLRRYCGLDPRGMRH